MNTIIKKILSISLGISVVASGISCFASQQTGVPIEEYMYDAKTVFVDDDLDENREKPISATLGSTNTVIEDETGNRAIKRKDWESFDVVAKNNFIDADKLVLAFDIKPTGIPFDEAISSGSFDKTQRAFIAYGIYAGGSGETGRLGTYSGTTIADKSESLTGWLSWGKGGYITVPQTNEDNNGYVRLVAVYERVKDESTGTYNVYMRNLLFNGKESLTNALKKESSNVANWWSDSSNYPFRIQNRTGAGTLPVYYDNFLIYEPYDFEIKEMECSSDFTSAEVAFTLGVNPDEGIIKLIDEDGETDCYMQLGDSKKQAIINFEKPVDLDNKSYYMSVKGIESVNGDLMKSQNYLISKKYADVNFCQAMMTDTDKMTGVLNLTAESDEEAYAVMSLYSGDECVDCSIQKVQLDSSMTDCDIVFEFGSEAVASANKVKMFLVDDIKNMKIVSDVIEAEIH